MTGKKIREISLADGSKRKVIQDDFEIIKENWNEYRLTSGFRLRTRQMIAAVYLAVDDDGNVIVDENGTPEVIVTASLHAVANEAEN